MKLAEALSIRADLQKRVAQLKERIKESAKVQEGDACKRTFHRCRENIQSQFGITVECNKSDIVLQPAFVRYFKQRWYVVGVKKQRSASEGKAYSSAEVDGDADLNADVDERKLVRCLPFDRISFLKLICEILLLYNKVQISSVYPQFASSDSIRCKRLWRYATLFCNSCFR